MLLGKYLDRTKAFSWILNVMTLKVSAYLFKLFNLLEFLCTALVSKACQCESF